MAFYDWATYEAVLNELRTQRSSWEFATTYKEFDEKITASSCAALKPGDQGLDKLVTGLRADFPDNLDPMYEQIRIVALAYPCESLDDFGEGWEGYFISELPNGDKVYSLSRYAAAAAWELVDDADDEQPQEDDPSYPTTPAEKPEEPVRVLHYHEETGLLYDEQYWYLPDRETIVEPLAGTDLFVDDKGRRYARGVLYTEPDLSKEHFDSQSGRMRRAYRDGEFEFRNAPDGPWERTVIVSGKSFWGRLHSDQYGWLAFDHASNTWLDTTISPPNWRAHAEVGSPLAEPRAERAEVSEVEQKARDQFSKVLAEIEQRRLRQAIERIRAKGIPPEKLSDEQIAQAFHEAAAEAWEPAAL